MMIASGVAIAVASPKSVSLMAESGAGVSKMKFSGFRSVQRSSGRGGRAAGWRAHGRVWEGSARGRVRRVDRRRAQRAVGGSHANAAAPRPRVHHSRRPHTAQRARTADHDALVVAKLDGLAHLPEQARRVRLAERVERHDPRHEFAAVCDLHHDPEALAVLEPLKHLDDVRVPAHAGHELHLLQHVRVVLLRPELHLGDALDGDAVGAVLWIGWRSRVREEWRH